MTTRATEYPILFNGDMVRAYLSGMKTQARRPVKTQPPDGIVSLFVDGTEFGPRWQYQVPVEVSGIIFNETRLLGRCPFGVPGDSLWVREKQRVIAIEHGRDITDEGTCHIRVRYEADGSDSGWIHYPDRLEWMPVVDKCLPYGGYRESSRLDLKTTDVRVERVQDISEEGAVAEGIKWDTYEAHECRTCAKGAFMDLWNSIYTKDDRGWDVNPWVWVVEFRVQQIPEVKR